MNYPIAIGGTAAVCLIAGFLSIHTVPEGHVGIVTTFGKATGQLEPGLSVRVPLIQSVREIEVRERKTVEPLSAATKNQLPITVDVSANWSVNPASALELYRRYGDLAQFEERVFDPKLRQAAKAALSQYNADELIRNRTAALGAIMDGLSGLLEGYPITVTSPQIENIEMPKTYLDAVLAKEKAREEAAREQYNLERQKLEAQREVQTAEAQRDANKARADGQAYAVEVQAKAEAEAIRLKGDAEASAVAAVQQAIAESPALVQYEKAKRWDGALPRTVVPNGAMPFVDVVPAQPDEPRG
ncbi:hypothetical protein ATO13_22256 [Stappia sp. 22II-S9-Z10]|nr:hypothetical protein ATO13_22256 [Stappia sp. 22II-S9-Z10]